MKISTSKSNMILAAAGAWALALLAAGAAHAQDRISVPLTDPARPVKLTANLMSGGIIVKGADVKEVLVESKTRADEDDKHNGKRGNMRRIPVNSTGLIVEEDNNNVRVAADSMSRSVDLVITVPRQTSVKLRVNNDGDINVSNVEGELDVQNLNGDVILTNVSGSALVHALNGDITVTLTRVAAKPMAFSSLNGEIDVTFPADLKANVSFKTGQGDVLSDFDVQMLPGAPQQIVEDGRGKGGQYRVRVDRVTRGTINGGGPEIQFTNHNGDIMIRKAGAPK